MKLLNYLQGLRKGKEAHRLEKEAMQDPFLADAMEGYDGTKENPIHRIEALRKQVSARSAPKNQHRAIGWSIAACLLLGVGVSTFFLSQKESLPEGEDTRIAREQSPLAAPVAETITPQPAIEATQQREVAENKKEAPQLVAAQPMAEEIRIVEENRVVKDSSLRKATTASLLADSRKVHGKVIDQHGEPIIGASVVVKGTNRGTISDVDGRFALDLDAEKELVVNYIGYESITLPADTTKNLLIAMNDDRQTLDEVVVVGYGSQKRQSMTGAVAALKIPGKPQPTIGWKAFRKYLKENLSRPTDAECARVKGKVVLTFGVSKEGRPEDITVKESLCPSADVEAILLIEGGPDWTVGEEPVEVSIKF